ncbi:hypothetical protein [Paenibacillus sp. CF384]|uniref:hypothetical protein n=1 Tax=Paenibacillus sp. CF384 TaxID=1884382 RepID=UPI0008949E46|nr:hypothetical protein [Paenibacillus sp. CF384]SDW76881.1 hypothetical protein SAMN05518855_100534 [Paenibacillus sp. CF384]
MRFQRKTLVMALACIILAVNVVGLAYAKNVKNDKDKLQPQQESNTPSSGQATPGINITPDSPVVSVMTVTDSDYSNGTVTESVYGSNWETELQHKKEDNRKGRLYKQDQYNYSQKDIEDLILGGATVEDIYMSDYVGNEWLIQPKALVETKKKQKVTWDEIELRIQNDTKKKLKMLEQKQAKALKMLERREMSDAEKLQLLQVAEIQGDDSLDTVMQNYEADGLEGLGGGAPTKEQDEIRANEALSSQLSDEQTPDFIEDGSQEESTNQQGSADEAVVKEEGNA